MNLHIVDGIPPPVPVGHVGMLLFPGAELCDALGCPLCRAIVAERMADGDTSAGLRRFQLHRYGGVVADGVRFPDGAAAVHWRGTHVSTVAWNDLASALAVHCDDGVTRLVWIDGGSP